MSVNTLNKTTRELEPIAGVPSTKIQSLDNQITNLNNGKLGEFVTVTDVTIDSVTYHTYWEVAPTASNQVYGVAIHPTDGRLCRIYNNKGTYTMQYYDKDYNTTTGDGIKIKVAQSADASPTMNTTVAANTTLDATTKQLLNNDAALNSALAWKSLYDSTHITLAKSGIVYFLTFNSATSAEVTTALATLKSYAPNSARAVKAVLHTNYGADNAIYLALFSLDNTNLYCSVISSFGSQGSDFFGSGHKLIGSVAWVYG